MVFLTDNNTTPTKVVLGCFGLLVGLWQFHELKDQVSSIKTVDLVAIESSASKLTSASKIQKSKIYKGKFCVQLPPRAAKIDQR